METTPRILKWLGSRTAVAFDRRTRVPAVFAVVEASDLIPSHRWDTLQGDRRYPRTLQAREYSGTFGHVARSIVATQILEPIYVLDPTRFPWGGPPICTSTGVVVVGNHRAVLLQRAALGQGDRQVAAYARYREELFATIDLWGVELAALTSLDAPVLVRVLDESRLDAGDAGGQLLSLQRLNILSDRTPTKAYDALSDGFAMAMSLRGVAGRPSVEFVASVTRLLGRAPLSAALRGSVGYDLVALLTSLGAVAPGEHPGLVAAGGKRLSASGHDRVQWMLRALVVGDKAALASAPKDIVARLDGCWGRLLEISVTVAGDAMQSRLAEALSLLGSAQAEGVPVDALGGSGDWFGPLPSSRVVHLALCLQRAPQDQLPALIDRWLETLRVRGAAVGDQTELVGFGARDDAYEVDEDDWLSRAVSELGATAARRKRAAQLRPEDYLSATEWSQLVALLPSPTERSSDVRKGGRPTCSNRSLAAGLVYVFEAGATRDSVVAAWARLPRDWIDRRLICGRTTLQRRLSRLDSRPGGRDAVFDVVASIAAARRGAASR